MRLRWWLLPLLALSFASLTGCAKVNEWLEGTVGEEEETDEETPEEKLAKAEADLAGSDAAKRKAAAAALFGIVLEVDEKDPEADRAVVVRKALPFLSDDDDAVVLAILNGLQTKTGFPEKTEDERQLDPEGYDRQLAEKTAVVEQGLSGVSAALQRDDESIRYRAMVVLCNLTRPPIVPDDAVEQVRGAISDEALKLALDDGQSLDLRLLAIEALVACAAGGQVGQLVPLLASDEAELRARVALAVGQAADWEGAAQAGVASSLVDLARDQRQPMSVRWCAAATLGRLGAGEGAGLDSPFAVAGEEEPYPNLEAYRTYALAHSGAAGEVVAELNAEMDAVATAAEEELDAERKKGYR